MALSANSAAAVFNSITARERERRFQTLERYHGAVFRAALRAADLLVDRVRGLPRAIPENVLSRISSSVSVGLRLAVATLAFLTLVG